MKKNLLFALFILFISGVLVGTVVAEPPAKYSEETITGSAQGNHELDCTIIRPWNNGGSGNNSYPVIVWANGWGGNNNAGETTTDGYKLGLIEWALDGPYIVVAANAWSPTESDVLNCLQWITDQNETSGSEYAGVINLNKIGLAGHSQGGGAVVKAGDGEPNGFNTTAVVAMSPYGPSWVNAGDQDGPMMILGGTDDLVTPVSSFIAVWEAIQTNGQGGLLAVLDGGDHSTDAWGQDDISALTQNFGRYQNVTNAWWQYHLNDNINAGRSLQRELNKAPWDTQYTFTNNFDLP